MRIPFPVEAAIFLSVFKILYMGRTVRQGILWCKSERYDEQHESSVTVLFVWEKHPSVGWDAHGDVGSALIGCGVLVGARGARSGASAALVGADGAGCVVWVGGCVSACVCVCLCVCGVCVCVRVCVLVGARSARSGASVAL